MDGRISEIAEAAFGRLNDAQKGEVYNKIWELAKMQDPRIDGARWGEENWNTDPVRLAKALHRLGFLEEAPHLQHPVTCLTYDFGEGGLGSQYFSLGEKWGRDHEKGHIGLVNGMGITSLAHAGQDAVAISDRLCDGHNLHCVYHATHQGGPSGDQMGYIQDVARMKAVEGGSYSKTAYLTAQQWIDFLSENPDKYFLQLAAS